MDRPPVIDTHAHICDPVFDPDRRAVLDQARKSGIVAVVAVGETLADAHRNLILADRYPLLRPAAGLYPTHLDRAAAGEMQEWIRTEHTRLAAIGEVGLDYWKVRDPEQQERQRDIFSTFIDLAAGLDLPLNVHSRSAGRHAVDLLLRRGARRVQMHAFDGKASAALPAAEAGYFFSIPPSAVHSRQKQKLVRALPLDRMLLETDSPVLGPEPAVRNVPANAWVSARVIADIKGVRLESVLERTLHNTLSLYGSDLLAEDRAIADAVNGAEHAGAA